MAAQTAMGSNDILYVLNFRYLGGHNSSKLEKALNERGWQKIADIQTCYVLKKKLSEDIQLKRIEDVLKDHINTARPGSEVRYGISTYIPPNQRPSDYDGIDTLFDEQ